MAPPAPDRLDGWKAIADHLDRDVRTLQRWRGERGLPIHRIPGSKGGTVFAYPAELDAWLREAPAGKIAEAVAAVAESFDSLPLAPLDSLALAPLDSLALAPLDSLTRAQSKPFDSLALAHFDSLPLAQGKQGEPFDSLALAQDKQGKQGKQDKAGNQGSQAPTARDPMRVRWPRSWRTLRRDPAEAAMPRRRGARRPSVLTWLAVAAAFAMGGIAAGTLGLPRPTRSFERAELRSGSLVALDSEGRAVWSFKLPERSAGQSAAPLFPSLKEAAPVDLDGDGERELVALLDFSEHGARGHGERGEVFCLSSRGALLWTFTPELTLTFGGRTFTGPWRNRAWLFAAPTTPVWISFIHQTWWPSFAMTLDAKGRSELKFVNAGHIESLGRVATPSGTYMLAGGTNNDYGAASLAVLDDQGSAATSPSSATSSMTCNGCPSGRPAKYFLFPRSELNVALGNTRNFVHLLTVNEGGGVDVTVREHDGAPPLRGVYRLSADLTPEWFAMSDLYWETHRRLSGEGKLNHSPEECPERKNGMSVRSWDPKSGWTQLLVPHAFAPARP